MRVRTQAAWIAVTVLALMAERSAAAQSTPAQPGTAPAPSAAGTGSVAPSAVAPILLNAKGADRLQTLHGDGPVATSTNAGRASVVVPHGGPQPTGASTTQAIRPEVVIRGQINPAAKSCYENDPASKSTQLARLVIVIKVTPAGDVDSVIVANSYELSPRVASCITTAARAAKFGPQGQSGATVRAAFTFPMQEDQAPPAPAPAKT